MYKRFIPLIMLLAWVGYAKAEETQTPPEETQTPAVNIDSIPAELSLRKKFYYGYNFDIYFHNDSKDRQTNNGWSFALTPEFGYKINEKTQVGVRLGGSYYSMHETYTITDPITKEDKDIKLKVRGGSWEIAPYGRYRLKTLFNNKVGIWLELHGYVSMSFPSVISGDSHGTDYEGLKHSVTYGAQLSPLITFKFSEKSTFNFFFSILSLGYSGTTRFYHRAGEGLTREYSNDLILFSGKLSNLITNHFTPGLYGIKFGVQKSF